jgi:hypothetical protein
MVDPIVKRKMASGFDENRALLSGELDWKRCLEPANPLDIEDCVRIDQFNEGVYEYNNSMLPRINELLRKMGYTPHKLQQPPKYAHAARQKKRQLMDTPEYRMLAAVKFLAKRDKYAERDFDLMNGPTLADEIAEREEIERLIAQGPIDITDAVGKAHGINCTCDLRWDGRSERCVAGPGGIRLRWARGKKHHFEAPEVKPAKALVAPATATPVTVVPESAPVSYANTRKKN